jgi:hypothetical protein
MANTRPFVAAACLCEHALLEQDGVFSLTRIVDTFRVQAQPVTPGKVGAFQTVLFVSLKSGDVTGKSELALTLHWPSGKVKEVGEKWPVLLNGGEHGCNFKVDLTIAVQEYGLYWIDVIWNGDTLSRIPFKLVLDAPSESAPEIGDSTQDAKPE